MKKLTATQEEVFERMKHEIQTARSSKTFEEYVERMHGMCPRWYVELLKRQETTRKHYEEARTQSIVTVCENSRTLAGLENRGLIEIIRDGKRGVDRVKVLDI